MELSSTPEEETLPWKQIVSKAVHDLRTPLSSIRVTLEVLRMTAAKPDLGQDKVLGMMDRQVDLISKLLETLATDPRAFLTQSDVRSEPGMDLTEADG